MAQGSFGVLLKNLTNSVTGIGAFVANAPKALHVYKTLKQRAEEKAPEDYVNQAEVFEETYWKRHLSQDENMWVDKTLSESLSRKDLVDYQYFKSDSWRVAHCGVLPFAAVGGWAFALYYPFYLANDTFIPSTFSRTPEQLKEWRAAQDLYRYKFAPAAVNDYSWFLNAHFAIPTKYGEKFDEVFEKNDIRRDPETCAQFHKAAEVCQTFFRVRRKQIRMWGRAHGMPTFPTLAKICIQTRVRDYWELNFNEDYMVISGASPLEKFTDEELYDYAWRRFLAPYDKNLTRQQLLVRVEDYFKFLGERFVNEGKVPNMFLTMSYCFGYYCDPAYLEADISELEADDFNCIKQWAKDVYIRRLEFENGPLRYQVEVAGLQALEERQKKLDAISK